MPDWLTNHPDAAARFREADRRYDRTIAAARNLRLADKLEAHRLAKATRAADYAAIIKGDRTNAA